MQLTKGKVVLGGIGGLLLISLMSSLFTHTNSSNSPYDADTTQKLAAAQARAEASPEYQANLRAAKAAAKAAQEQAESKERAEKLVRLEAVAGAQQIKDSMKDPDSFQLKSALLMADHSVCYEYSATNTFGGRMREYAVLTPKGRINFNDSGVWNKYCANKNGDELALAAQ
jgi:hypothetical protein